MSSSDETSPHPAHSGAGPVDPQLVLTLNAGSTSIRFSVQGIDPRIPRLRGMVHRIGREHAELTFSDHDAGPQRVLPLAAATHSEAVASLVGWLESRGLLGCVHAIGHRVVSGGPHTHPEIVTPALLDELEKLAVYDPDHLPAEIALMRVMGRRCPRLPQIACFDSEFHSGLPRVATQLAIPRRYEKTGLRRYGFHGLSFSYSMSELRRLKGQAASKGRVVLAHLGGGASMAAVKDGQCIDTSMGFSPAGGLMMGTRAGDVDPGVVFFLARHEKMEADAIQKLLNRESGLLGVSQTSGDFQELLAIENADPRAAEAIDLFCYQAAKWIGSFAAALGGLDTLIFSGGIGGNSPVARKRICKNLGFLGVELDPDSNSRSNPLISSGPVEVRVIRIDEEAVIARAVFQILNTTTAS